jgi:hypothetical protein
VRDLAVVFVNYALAGGLDVFGFIAEKACRVNVLFKLFLADLEVVLRPSVLAKEIGRDDVHTSVCALSAEDRGDEQFKRRRVIQGAVSVWVCLFEAANDLERSLFKVLRVSHNFSHRGHRDILTSVN